MANGSKHRLLSGWILVAWVLLSTPLLTSCEIWDSCIPHVPRLLSGDPKTLGIVIEKMYIKLSQPHSKCSPNNT